MRRVNNSVYRWLKRILLVFVLLSLAACGAKSKNGNRLADGGESMGMGVEDSVEFHGTNLDSEQGNTLKAKNIYHFDYDSYAVREEDMDSIYAHAKKLMADPKKHIRLEGHTDERGSREYNVALGERRAQAVANIFRLKGVSDDQISVVSYGKEKPSDQGHGEAAWSQNRRGVVVYETN